MRLIRLLLLSSLLAPCTGFAEKSLKMGFGSCLKLEKAKGKEDFTTLWSSILRENIDYWVWAGDSIYADSQDTGVHRKLYGELKAFPPYKRLRETAQILGTWDDHDFGLNNGNSSFPSKVRSQDAFLDFLDVNPEHPRRARQGVYHSQNLALGPYKIKLILLDVRYFRTEKTTENADILGLAQWNWLHSELKEFSDLTIIVSGTQVLPQKHSFERWDEYPEARSFLLSLLDSSPTRNIILISGDRHVGETFSKRMRSKTIFEITTSGLSHFWQAPPLEPSPFRRSKKLTDLNYSMITLIQKDKTLRIRATLKSKTGIIHDEIRLKSPRQK